MFQTADNPDPYTASVVFTLTNGSLVVINTAVLDGRVKELTLLVHGPGSFIFNNGNVTCISKTKLHNFRGLPNSLLTVSNGSLALGEASFVKSTIHFDTNGSFKQVITTNHTLYVSYYYLPYVGKLWSLLIQLIQ